MTVRHKITLLITAAGFAASLVFSCVILWEMMEQPFSLIDADLKSTGLRVARLAAASEGTMEQPLGRAMGDERYWLEIKDRDSGRPLYRSPMARRVPMEEPPPGQGTTVQLALPEGRADQDKGDFDKVTFRVLTTPLKLGGKEYLACVGRPIENLEEELWDTVTGVAGGLVFSVLLLAGISYLLAGFMLKPVRAISEQAREISERHLDRRMPTSGNHDEFDTLALTLNKVFDRLQHAFFRQKRLLADASHELKTPLTMMRLALDDIRSGLGETGPDPQAENHERMTMQVLRMERLVKSLLDLSALEIEASAAMEPLDLAPILASLVADYRLMAEANGIRVDADLPKRLDMEGDKEKLTRVFSNLLDNAIKYNVEGGRVRIVGERSDTGVSITLGNTGPGVPEADISKIFEQFFRVEKSRSLLHGGSGLGLAIVKRIVELHGGTVQFESRPNNWTTVTVHLPQRLATPWDARGGPPFGASYEGG